MTPDGPAGHPSAYPERWENDVVLVDGGTVHIRPVTPDDADRVRRFHERQSREAIYFRYFTPMPVLADREIERLTRVDHQNRMAFVALLADDIIGMASYDIWRERNEGEVAFIVDESQQGRGLATVLLEYLIVAARENGLAALSAQVLPTNRRMLSVFHQVGFEVTSRFEEGIIEVRFSLDATERSEALIGERERRAEARSIHRLLHPQSIAVIGASRERGGLGHEVFRNLVAHGVQGPVFPVNPLGGFVGSVRAYASVLDIPDEVDLAIVAVPAASVLEVVDECARKRVVGLVIISAGLDALTIDGLPAPQVIVARALASGIRVIGPESLGLINTDPAAQMHATFASVDVVPGTVGFLTQSGTLGVAALEHARRTGVGISAFVDIGSRVDVSGNDLLQFWREDERTQVVLLYLESFGNPRKFTRIAREMSRDKPIVAVKSGRTTPWGDDEPRPGAPDIPGLWPTDATVGAMLSQSGVMRVDTPAQLFNVARVLADQPVPRGRRVAVVSNARGATRLTVDACRGARLDLAPLSPATTDHLDRTLGARVSGDNPVEMTWDATPTDYATAVRAVLDDDAVDAVIIVYAPPLHDRRSEMADALGAAIAGAAPKTLVATFLGSDVGVPLVSGDATIPLFEFPGEAAHVLGVIATYGEWLGEPAGETVEVDDEVLGAVRALVADVLSTDPEGSWLSRERSADLLRAMGLSVAPHEPVTSPDAAVAAAQRLGYPVVLKAAGVARFRRGEGGGVALDLHDDTSVVATFNRMRSGLGEAMDVAIVQAQVPTGIDVLMGAHQQESFGAVVSIGLGGVSAPAEGTRPVRVLPLTDAHAQRLLAESPVSAMLRTHDPSGRATEACLAALQRLAAVADQVPDIADVVLNPVVVSGAGACVVEGWVRVAPYRSDQGPAVRRL